MTGLFPGELLWCRLSIAGIPADNSKMTAIQSTRKQILHGNTFGTVLAIRVPLIRSRAAYSFP
jgi:hypothetical protein